MTLDEHGRVIETLDDVGYEPDTDEATGLWWASLEIAARTGRLLYVEEDGALVLEEIVS